MLKTKYLLLGFGLGLLASKYINKLTEEEKELQRLRRVVLEQHDELSDLRNKITRKE